MAKKDAQAAKQGLDDIFNSSGPDLLGSVIASDRKRAGRRQADTQANSDYDNMTSQNVIKQADIMTSHKTAPVAEIEPTALRAVEKKPTLPKKETPPTKATKTAKATSAELLAKRIELAHELTKSTTMTVTLRIPHKLNEWLDEYVHEGWREKIKKQDLVVEALQLLIARRGRVGDEVLPTELLGKE